MKGALIMNAIDEKEFDTAIEEAKNDSAQVFVKLRKPIEYNGKRYEELSFDFDKLTGRDALAIENEIARLGRATMVPALSGDYIVRMAARACTEVIGIDLFDLISLKDYETIKSRARNFLIMQE